MRLWSIHPKYLDSFGLLGLWREGLLAKKVLEGKTKGYKNHPQLLRFKNYSKPILAINAYLTYVFLEAKKRNYKFDKSKINFALIEKLIPVTISQVKFEFEHLLKKLKKRNKNVYKKLKNLKKIEINPIFYLVKGPVEPFEKI